MIDQNNDLQRPRSTRSSLASNQIIRDLRKHQKSKTFEDLATLSNKDSPIDLHLPVTARNTINKLSLPEVASERKAAETETELVPASRYQDAENTRESNEVENEMCEIQTDKIVNQITKLETSSVIVEVVVIETPILKSSDQREGQRCVSKIHLIQIASIT